MNAITLFLLVPLLADAPLEPYGERKRRDFFVRHLHGVAPPEWQTVK